MCWRLKDEPQYGYEVMKSARCVFPDVYEGTIYTILRRLNSTGYTHITKRESHNGPARKYYGITEIGKEYLDQMIIEWQEMVEKVAALGISS